MQSGSGYPEGSAQDNVAAHPLREEDPEDKLPGFHRSLVIYIYLSRVIDIEFNISRKANAVY